LETATEQFRGFFSVVFRLLQMVGRLLHFYERHLHEAGYKNTYKRVQDQLAAMVNPSSFSTAHQLRAFFMCVISSLWPRTRPDDSQ